jgi:hypothetical protein
VELGPKQLEILRLIATAPTDPQPVFELIAETAVKQLDHFVAFCGS